MVISHSDDAMAQAADEEEAIRQRVYALLETIPDPEIPVVSIRELGILRDVVVHGEQIEVLITPTYSGCPALKMIEDDVLSALRIEGFNDAVVRTVLSPAWSSDWITTEAREKLRAYGIAPPQRTADDQARGKSVKVHFFKTSSTQLDPAAGNGPADGGPTDRGPTCPRCGSRHTEQLSAFGSTSCKALHRCIDCREPFDYFKPI
jgi:ring-1,2-phenylacetyl-CoA epoxidase subunit PaaD